MHQLVQEHIAHIEMHRVVTDAIVMKAAAAKDASSAIPSDKELARQADLLAVCRQAGMRLVGPNCMGVINTAPDVSMNATLARQHPRAAGSASCRRAAPSAWR